MGSNLFSRRPGERFNRGRIQIGPVTPQEITPLTIVSSVPIVSWWRADRGVWLDGGGTKVVLLQDQYLAGSHYDLAASGDPAVVAPTYVASSAAFNNRPCLQFDGVANMLSTLMNIPAPATTARHYWMICRQRTWTNGRVLWGGNGGFCQLVFQNSATPQVWLYNGSSVSGNTQLPLNTGKLVRARFGNAATDQLIVGTIGGAQSAAGNNSSTTWNLGGGGAAGQYSALDFAEGFITDGEPSAGELAALAAYGTTFYGASFFT